MAPICVITIEIRKLCLEPKSCFNHSDIVAGFLRHGPECQKWCFYILHFKSSLRHFALPMKAESPSSFLFCCLCLMKLGLISSSSVGGVAISPLLTHSIHKEPGWRNVYKFLMFMHTSYVFILVTIDVAPYRDLNGFSVMALL